MNLIGNWSYPIAMRFGAGCISEIVEACKSAGLSKLLLVTDKDLASMDVTAKTLRFLKEAGMGRGMFSGVDNNPSDLNAGDWWTRLDPDGIHSIGAAHHTHHGTTNTICKPAVFQKINRSATSTCFDSVATRKDPSTGGNLVERAAYKLRLFLSRFYNTERTFAQITGMDENTNEH